MQYNRILWRGFLFLEKQRWKINFHEEFIMLPLIFWEEVGNSKINSCLVRAANQTLHSSKRFPLYSLFVSRSTNSIKCSCSDQSHGKPQFSHTLLYIKTQCLSLVIADWLGITKPYEQAEAPGYFVPEICFFICLFREVSYPKISDFNVCKQRLIHCVISSFLLLLCSVI